MFSDSDEEYDEHGAYLRQSQSRERPPHLRLYHSIEYGIKNQVFRKVIDERALLDSTKGSPFEPSDREMLRAHLDDPDVLPWDDWRRWRVLRFFREIQGFHAGDLDLTGRSQARYEALMQRFWAILSDIKSMLPLVEMVECDEVDYGVKLTNVPAIRSKTLWNVFRRKWNLPRTIDYAELTSLLVETHNVLVAHPEPKFQSFCITELPPEVATMIFGYATVEEARTLSATCRYLRDVGLTYIYTTRRIFMSCPGDICELVVATERKTIVEQVIQLLTASHDKCIHDMDFLSSRPDICARVRRVSVGDRWSAALCHDAEIRDALEDALASQIYSRAFVQRLAQILPQLALEYLSLHGLEINTELAMRIGQQSDLANLEVECCEVPPALSEHILASAPGSLQSNVSSLILQLHQCGDIRQTFSAWNILSFCPNLRLLRVVAHELEDGFDTPEQHFWPHMACISHVEYLHLHGLYWNQLGDLVDWLSLSAAGTGSLGVSHLKLHSPWGIPDAMVGQLLQALHIGQAPLRVLALDGIMGTDAVFFDTLAQLFPSLEGLTLVRRANDRQCKSLLCQWPRPVYEYAQHMQGLTRLRHFGANFHWKPDSISPSVLQRLEHGHATDQDPGGTECDYVDDRYSVALPFAAYCPALETFAITAESMLCGVRVHRAASGAIDIESLESHLLSGQEFDEWNPGAHSPRAWQLPERKG